MAVTKRCMVCLTVLGAILSVCGSVRAEKIEPPWTSWHRDGIIFTVPGIDNVPDLWGEIVEPDLVIFFAGNQFMVIHDLLDAFRKQYPHYQKIYVETLPPGILARQMAEGSLIIGNLKITLTPDIFTAGEQGIKAVEKKHPGIFERTVPYARNRLAIMVHKGNPKKITTLKDLSKPGVRVSMPNPAWEGIGKTILKAYEKTGGKQLVEQIMKQKVENGTTFLTHIHHRQTPIRIMRHESDVGPVWYTEARFQQMIKNPIGMVEIPEKDNVVSTYVAGILKNAPHGQAAADFMAFLTGQEGQTVYRKYGFLPLQGEKRK